MSVIAFSPVIGPVPISCCLRERHASDVEVTRNPVEFGADVTDHAYVLPKKISLEIADENAALTYNALVRFQESRIPFTIVTGLYVYTNMLITRMDAERDATFSRVLKAEVFIQEIIIVGTAYVPGDGDPKGNPGGAKSTRAARPDPRRSGDAVTADRASGTSMRGDAGTRTAPVGGSSPAGIRNQSILSSMFGS